MAGYGTTIHSVIPQAYVATTRPRWLEAEGRLRNKL